MTLATTTQSTADRTLYGTIRFALVSDEGWCHRIGPAYRTAAAAIEAEDECTREINARNILTLDNEGLKYLRIDSAKVVLIDASEAADESIYTDGKMHPKRARALHRATGGVLMAGARVDLGSVCNAETRRDWKRLGIVEADGEHWRLTEGAAEAACEAIGRKQGMEP